MSDPSLHKFLKRLEDAEIPSYRFKVKPGKTDLIYTGVNRGSLDQVLEYDIFGYRLGIDWISIARVSWNISPTL